LVKIEMGYHTGGGYFLPLPWNRDDFPSTKISCSK